MTDDYLYFSSEFAPLSNLIKFNLSEIDEEILFFLTYGYVPGSETLNPSIKKLEPGTILTIKLSNNILKIIRKVKYWDLTKLSCNKSTSEFNKESLKHSYRFNKFSYIVRCSNWSISFVELTHP